jgi:hypothetical protein
MDYELADELKKAGFPQGELNGFVGLMNVGQGDEHGRAYFPTLSELIEACGDRFHLLERMPSPYHDMIGWKAKGPGARGVNVCMARSPEAAVAGLWLLISRARA